MQEAELILSVLGSSDGSIDGRTAIQKIAYFCSIKTDVNMGYKPHFYGPYSPRMAGLLESLVSAGYIGEKVTFTAQDRTMYSYYLTKDGRKIANLIRKKEPEQYAIVTGVVDKCRKTVKNDINTLSMAAKVYFLLSQKGEKITYGEAKEMGKTFGWQLTNKKVNDGVKLLTSLELAATVD